MIHFYTSAKPVKSLDTLGFLDRGGPFWSPGTPPGVPGTGELGFHGAGPGDVTLYVRMLRNFSLSGIFSRVLLSLVVLLAHVLAN